MANPWEIFTKFPQFRTAHRLQHSKFGRFLCIILYYPPTTHVKIDRQAWIATTLTWYCSLWQLRSHRYLMGDPFLGPLWWIITPAKSISVTIIIIIIIITTIIIISFTAHQHCAVLNDTGFLSTCLSVQGYSRRYVVVVFLQQAE